MEVALSEVLTVTEGHSCISSYFADRSSREQAHVKERHHPYDQSLTATLKLTSKQESCVSAWRFITRQKKKGGPSLVPRCLIFYRKQTFLACTCIEHVTTWRFTLALSRNPERPHTGKFVFLYQSLVFNKPYPRLGFVIVVYFFYYILLWCSQLEDARWITQGSYRKIRCATWVIYSFEKGLLPGSKRPTSPPHPPLSRESPGLTR